ncbi:MAG: Peptidase M16 inactive domain protein [Elusimicrobia bacterium ADurb.Bin231]|nr:MAG: Peptidase M16 inactive domain protein [Elusimicrobia bacterium ADurb.Bin231]
MKKYIYCFFAFSLQLSFLSAQVINYTKLDSGVTLIHVEEKGSGTVSASLFVRGGNSGESAQESGITWLMLKLLLKGTGKYNAEQIALETELLGASITSGCSNDYSEISLTVLAKNFTPAFQIFADVINNPVFPEKEFETEKRKLLATIMSKNDSIFDTSLDLFYETIYRGHPYGMPVTGYYASVSSLTVAQAADRYNKMFRKDDMIISVAGDIEFAKLKETVEKFFPGVKQVPAEEYSNAGSGLLYAQGESFAEKKIFKGKFGQSFIFSGFLAPCAGERVYPAIKLINAIYGGGMGSRLFEQLREKYGFVYEASSFYPTRISSSVFAVYAGTSKENIESVESAIKDTLKNISPISEQELLAGKEFLKGTYLMDHRTQYKRAWYLGMWEAVGLGYGYDTTYIKDIDNVTPYEIHRVIGAYFDISKLVTIIVE